MQVAPDRFKRKDTATIDFKEALHIEKIRNELFIQLYELLENEKEDRYGFHTALECWDSERLT